MAEAPADPGQEGHLEKAILRVLTEANGTMKTAQLVKECRVTKKELNQALYRLKNKQEVSQVAPSTWRVGGDGLGGSRGPAQLALPGPAEMTQQDAVAVPENPGPQFSQQRQDDIYRFLKDKGPHRALAIAQALGMSRAKDVNPDLYQMKNRHQLHLDEGSKIWTVYPTEDSGRGIGNSSVPVVYQQCPITMICQNGPNSHISIANSEATQIGHGNVIAKQMAWGEKGSSAPGYLPRMALGVSSTQGPADGTWGPQDIRLERSLLKRVQLGHGNEMSLHSTPSEVPAHTPSGSPPVSATPTSAGASYEVQMPQPGPHPEGAAAQKVHIKSCSLEDATIGNSNKMMVNPRVAGPGGATEEQGEDADPGPAAIPTRSDIPGDVGAAVPDSISVLAPRMEAVTLGSQDPEVTEGSHCTDKTPDSGSQRGRRNQSRQPQADTLGTR
ncbi:Z-DNA-binding protein 1 [Carlito syrichta]|uniref:Z-DNA-binding protein 1 n=1 Tax=Carlito syrichta TaxID=1868482 RepID=A0A1U7TI01_CARSF|nr:Z-DNA-binding protein 1 [Carlito syrichta]